MASTTMTYGKKRSFLGSLGSRRRQVPVADPTPEKNPERRRAQSVNIRRDTVNPNPLAMHSVRPTSVEEIASALLDDSTIIRRAEGGVQQPDGNPLESSISTPPSLENSNLDASTPPPRGTKTSRGQALRSGAPRVQKNTPRSPSKTPSRAYMTRTRSSSSPAPKESSMVRPLVSPVKASLDRSQPIMRNEGASCLLPHNVMDTTPKVLLQNKRNAPALPRGVDSDEIQEKVNAMLAATDALKPPTTPMKKSSASKMSRMVPSVLAKVSDAWDRLHVKPSDSGSKQTKLGKKPAQENSGGLALKPSSASRSTSSINTIEIRLNEGHNLNRRKVQQIVGGGVTRKPVADDGKAFRNGQSTDDPFSGPVLSHSLKAAGDQPSLGSDIQSDVNSLLFLSPFESEMGFENNLEDRILSTSPIGSSTPRIRVYRIPTPSLDENANEQHSVQSSQINLTQVTIKLTDYESLEVQAPNETPDETGHMNLARSTDRLGTRAIRERPKMIIVPEYRGTKKHPSPSKKDLEDLQMALEWYAELKKRCGEDELDELAAQYAPSVPVLSPRDKNRLMNSRLSSQDHPMLNVPTTHHDARSPAKSRMSLPSDDLGNRRHQIRLGPAYRPMISQADETDELQ